MAVVFKDPRDEIADVGFVVHNQDVGCHGFTPLLVVVAIKRVAGGGRATRSFHDSLSGGWPGWGQP